LKNIFEVNFNFFITSLDYINNYEENSGILYFLSH